MLISVYLSPAPPSQTLLVSSLSIVFFPSYRCRILFPRRHPPAHAMAQREPKGKERAISGVIAFSPSGALVRQPTDPGGGGQDDAMRSHLLYPPISGPTDPAFAPWKPTPDDHVSLSQYSPHKHGHHKHKHRHPDEPGPSTTAGDPGPSHLNERPASAAKGGEILKDISTNKVVPLHLSSSTCKTIN